MNWLKRKLWQPLLDLLTQGVTPRALALSVSVGLVIAVIPALGVTTGLCALVAVYFRLNMVAIQVANYAAYPLQFALLIPFYRMGGWLFREDAGQWTAAAVVELVKQDPWIAVERLWTVAWHALVVWALLAGPAIWILSKALAPAFERVAARVSGKELGL